MALAKHTYSKAERLKSVLVLDKVFSEGSKIKAFPILARHTPSSFEATVPIKLQLQLAKEGLEKLFLEIELSV